MRNKGDAVVTVQVRQSVCDRQKGSSHSPAGRFTVGLVGGACGTRVTLRATWRAYLIQLSVGDAGEALLGTATVGKNEEPKKKRRPMGAVKGRLTTKPTWLKPVALDGAIAGA